VALNEVSIVAVIASRSSAISRLYPTTSALRATISDCFWFNVLFFLPLDRQVEDCIARTGH